MDRTEKERVVTELAAQLRSVESLIVADYRGLTNSELEELRVKLRPHGARLTIVKNTLTRRAAEAAGAEALLALLEGPTAIAFVEAEGDAVAAAKALSETARQTKVMTLRGGILQGTPMSGEDVESLAKLPPMDVLRGQLIGVIVAPLTQLIGLLTAPLRDLVGLIDARIAQLEATEPAAPAESAPADSATEPQASADVDAPDEAQDEAVISPQPEAADGDADEAGEE